MSEKFKLSGADDPTSFELRPGTEFICEIPDGCRVISMHADADGGIVCLLDDGRLLTIPRQVRQ